MNNRKIIITVLIITFISLLIYTVWSKNSSLEKIKCLTQKIENNVDSLKNVSNRYDSLAVAYNKIYIQLDSTKFKLNVFKSDVDSIMNLRITTVANLNDALKKIIEEQKLDQLDTSKITGTDFRLN